MAEYILQDKDKAAFINRMNKVLSQIGDGLGVDQSSFVDVPEIEDEDKCIFIAANDIEEKVLDSLIDKNAFTYKIKKINVNEILREIKRELGEAEYPSDPKYIPRQDKMDPADIVLSKNRTYFVIPINAPEPQYEKVQYNGRNKDTGEYNFTFGPNITGATGLTLKYIDRTSRVWTNVGHSKPPHKPDTILVKDKAVADKWVAGEYNGGYKIKKVNVNEILGEIKRELKEEIKYNESIINGKSYFSEFFGSTPSESEFIELIQRVPETVKSIEVPVTTAKFSPSKKKYEGPITSQDKNDLIRIIKAMTLAFEEEEDPITNYVIRSYYGVSKNEATDRVYIQFETEGKRRFDTSMSRGDYGPLD